MATRAEMYKIESIKNGFVAIMAQPSPEEAAPASFANIAGLGVQLVVSLLEFSSRHLAEPSGLSIVEKGGAVGRGD